MLVGMGNPLGTRNLHGYGFGQNFIPAMDMSFLAGVFFLRGYEFEQVIPSRFLPIVISSIVSIIAGSNRQGHCITEMKEAEKGSKVTLARWLSACRNQEI
jgi:hypothetical protein